MSTEDANRQRTTDAGRLIALPVMCALAIVNLASVHPRLVEASSPAMRLAGVTRTLLMAGFYVLIVAFYVLRTRARATTGSLPARVLAVVTTTPFGIAFLAGPVSHPVTLAVANVLLCLGLGWSVWSLRHLGRSFSIVAQARSLVRTGPYRFVRHPLYLGELVAVLGVVMAGFSWQALGLFGMLLALQVYRASKEEELLAESFPEYAAYRLHTSRLVPHLF